MKQRYDWQLKPILEPEPELKTLLLRPLRREALQEIRETLMTGKNWSIELASRPEVEDRDVYDENFRECDTCRAKPGTPTLCIKCRRSMFKMYKLESTWGGKGVRYFCTDEKAPKKDDIISLDHYENGKKASKNYKVTGVYATGEHWAGMRVEAMRTK